MFLYQFRLAEACDVMQSSVLGKGREYGNFVHDLKGAVFILQPNTNVCCTSLYLLISI